MSVFVLMFVPCSLFVNTLTMQNMNAECIAVYKQPSDDEKLLSTAALKWSHVGRTFTDKNMEKESNCVLNHLQLFEITVALESSSASGMNRAQF